MIERPNTDIHVVSVEHEEIAWDIVIRHLLTFSGEILLFIFPNSDVYDAGVAELHYSSAVRQFDSEGALLRRLTMSERRQALERKAAVLDRAPPPPFYPLTNAAATDVPWIFRLVTPAGKILRTAVWDGRRDYAHELPADCARWVGGNNIAVVQVDSPVGINRRSSLDLTHTLSSEFDGVIHWARDTDTFQSILKSFIRLDLESASPPQLPDHWNPHVVILAANGDA